MSVGFWQVVLIVLVIMVLFGAGRISKVMEDMGKGVKAFKKGLNDEDKPSQDSKS